MTNSLPSVFFSYSRDNSDFVDRLEADFRARGFMTWVDRRRLEGTTEWQPQIDRAIGQHDITLVVLTPMALKSAFVRHEYELASNLGKRLVTVILEDCPTLPSELAISKVQWIDFKNQSYEKALGELIDGCQEDPSVGKFTDLMTLYNQAHDLETSDPERAVVLYQRLLRRDPNYFGGEAQRDLVQLNWRLYPVRAQKLRAQAEAARTRGEYDVEAGALEALVALGDQDIAMFSWGRKYLEVAKQNRAWLNPYENIKHLAAGSAEDLAAAREKLLILWKDGNAPYFRDPAGVAPVLSLKVPPTYDEAEEHRQAESARTQSVQNAWAEHDALVRNARAKRDSLVQQALRDANLETEQENRQWQSALAFLQSVDIRRTGADAKQVLEHWGLVPDSYCLSLVTRQRLQASLIGEAEAYRLRGSDGQYRYKVLPNIMNNMNEQLLPVLGLVILPLLIVFTFCSLVSIIPSSDDSRLGESGCLAIVIGPAVCALSLWLWGLYNARRVRAVDQSLFSGKQELDMLIKQWRDPAEAEHSRRLASIEEKSRQLMSYPEAAFQERMAQINAQHELALAEIAQRYRQA